MATNRLVMRNVRAVPNQIPAGGGAVVVQFEAHTPVASATASVAYAAAPGSPYQVTNGSAASPAINVNVDSTVSQNVTLTPTQQTPVSFIQLDVTASVPGDTNQTMSCFVWIANPLGDHLKRFRARKGLSQDAIAKKLRTSAATVSHVERGRFPSPALEEAIAKVLK